MSDVRVADSDRDFISYIPPINRSVVQELDRSLRDTLKVFSQNQNGVDSRPTQESRDILGSVGAVERAASLIVSMTSRIRDLETSLEGLDARHAALTAERAHLASHLTLVSEKLALETERRDSAEALNKEHEIYSRELADNLAKAHADIERLTAVIARAFGSIQSGDA